MNSIGTTDHFLNLKCLIFKLLYFFIENASTPYLLLFIDKYIANKLEIWRLQTHKSLQVSLNLQLKSKIML